MPSAQLRELVVSLSSPLVEPLNEWPIELPIELGPAVTRPPSAASSASFASAPELDTSLDDVLRAFDAALDHALTNDPDDLDGLDDFETQPTRYRVRASTLDDLRPTSPRR